jgi:PAS domain S-box-containing protein
MEDKSKILRERAKDELKKGKIIDVSLYETDLKVLVEELSIYQIELEHQNQELIQSQGQIQQSKDRYLDLFDNAPIGYLIVDSDGLIKDINQTACLLLESDKYDLLGYKITRIIHPDYQDVYYIYFRTLINQRHNQTCDIKLQRSKNTFFFARIHGIRQPHLKSDEPEFRLAISDVTIQKEMEIKLLLAKEKAEENDKLKSVFLANMSHEIRTPMNGIIGFADLLKDPNISHESQISFVEIIQKSGHRLLDLINELIDISKIEAGQMQVKISPTNIPVLLIELNQFFAQEATNKNLNLTFESHLNDYNYKVETDKDKLFGILVNLIKNSIKYSKKGRISFGVYKAGPHLKFFVKDSGIGIPEEKFHIIFQRFRQVEETSFHQGTGLGLSIVKGMVELLGGRVGFASKFNKGSIFYFTIPDKPVIVNNIFMDSESSTLPALKDIIIFVAEDDFISSVLIKQILKGSNANIYFVENGVHLMSLLKDITPHIILLDINMPLKNGYECLKEIREKGIQSKIIAVTANALNGDKETLLSLGCNGYISKPYKKETLYKEIEKLICR